MFLTGDGHDDDGHDHDHDHDGNDDHDDWNHEGDIADCENSPDDYDDYSPSRRQQIPRAMRTGYQYTANVANDRYMVQGAVTEWILS